ncbi:MAG: hypothetical protein DRQ57_16790 [Gammaproteobacteria bacterium]|nr:MAG: hypothetical protein DRQ57_16790 [Gammaproteobacteria bacterium]
MLLSKSYQKLLLVCAAVLVSISSRAASDKVDRLIQADNWTPDKTCRVTTIKSSEDNPILRWDLAADCSVFGQVGFRADNLNLNLPDVLSFEVHSPSIAFLTVLVGDSDGTIAFYMFCGLPVDSFKGIDVDTAKPQFLWAKGKDGKLSDVQNIFIGVEPRGGEVQENGNYKMFFRHFRMGAADKAKAKISSTLAREMDYAGIAKYKTALSPEIPVDPTDFVAGMTGYEKTRAAAQTAVDSLAQLIEKAKQAKIGIDYEQITFKVAKDAISWSAMDARFGVDKKYPRLLEEAQRQIEWVVAACDKECVNLSARIEGNDVFKLNRPDVLSLQIKNGNYYAENRPVILTGVMSPWTEAVRPYGFNIVDHHEFNNGQGAKNHININRNNKVAASLMTEIKALSNEQHKENPDLDPNGFRRWRNHFAKVNIDSPTWKKIRKKIMDNIIPVIADEANLASYLVWNELWYSECPYYPQADFQKYIKNIYNGDLSRLNAQWGTSFKSFDKLIYVPWRRAARVDMGRYTAHRVTRWVKWDIDNIRKMAPDMPLGVKVHGGWWSILGADADTLGEVVSINSADMYPYPIVGQSSWSVGPGRYLDRRFAADFWTQAIITDTYRSLQPGKPIVDTEYHIAPYTENNVPPEFTKAMFWQGALHGRDMVTIWIGQRRGPHNWIGYKGGDYLFLTQPWMVQASGKAGLDMERLSDEIVAFQDQKADVALLRCGIGFTEWYKQSYFQDCAFDLITPDKLEKTGAKAYKLLLIPDGAYLSQKAVNQVATFVKNGGFLCVGADAMKLNEREVANDLSGLDMNSPAISRGRFDRLAADIDLAINKTDIKRSVESDGKYIELRVIKKADKNILYAINFNPVTQDVTLKMQGKPVQGLDLISRKAVNGTVRMKPMDVILVEFE